jgi:hypothetical protein
MKTFLITILFITIFTNCSRNNAFSYFQIDKEQAKSEDSLKSSKIFNKTDNEGIVSAIYLNHVLPDEYNDKEYFYIYLYTKNDLEKVNFVLNGKESQDVITLKSHNKFSNLTSFDGDWQRYYLVVFSKEKKSVLALQAKTLQSSSLKMIFIKD